MISNIAHRFLYTFIFKIYDKKVVLIIILFYFPQMCIHKKCCGYRFQQL